MHWPGTWGLPHSRTPSQSTSDPALCWNVNSIYIKIGIVHHQKLNHLNCYQNHKISVGVVVVKEFCLRFLFFPFYGYSGDIWKSLEIWEKLCRFKIWYYSNVRFWSIFKRSNSGRSGKVFVSPEKAMNLQLFPLCLGKGRQRKYVEMIRELCLGCKTNPAWNGKGKIHRKNRTICWNLS